MYNIQQRNRITGRISIELNPRKPVEKAVKLDEQEEFYYFP